MSSTRKSSVAANVDASESSPRPYIFIDSSNPVAPNTVIRHDESKPILKLPFPPLVDAHDLIVNKKNQSQTTPSKPPNAFIIYRRTFVATARAEGYNLPMTVVSTMASQSWDNEAPEVKSEYKNIARQAKALYDSMYPKQTTRKAPKRWRVFQAKTPRTKQNDADMKRLKPAASSSDLPQQDLVEVHETFDFTSMAADASHQHDSISSFTELWVPNNDDSSSGNSCSSSNNVTDSASVVTIQFEDDANLPDSSSIRTFSELNTPGSLSPNALLLEPVTSELFFQDPISPNLLTPEPVSPASSVSTTGAISPLSLDIIANTGGLPVMSTFLDDGPVLGCHPPSSLTQHQAIPYEQQEDFATFTTFVAPYVDFYGNYCL